MDASRVAERVFPEQQVHSSDQIHEGNRKQTSVVEFVDRNPVVVQIASDIDPLRSGAAVTAVIDNTTSVPVPTLLGGGVVDGAAYLVTEQVPGANLHERFSRLSAGSRRTIITQFGRFLGEIHATDSFDACGDLQPTSHEWTRPVWPTDTADPELDVCDAVDPETWLRDTGMNAIERLPPAFDPEARRFRKRLSAGTVTTDDSTSAVLFPWDFRPGNALINDDGLAALVDWEAPMAAPAALSVAKAEYLVVDWYVEQPTADHEAFRAGYEAVRPYPDIPPLVRTLAIVLSAVDSTGTVTNPMYPELDRSQAIRFHRSALAASF